MSRMFYSSFLRDKVIVELEGYILYESPYKNKGRVEIIDDGENYRLEIYEDNALSFSACTRDISLEICKDIYTEKGEIPVGDEYLEAIIIKIPEIKFKKTTT